MKYLVVVLFITCVWVSSCYEPYPETVPLDTSVCVRTQHHTWIIPDATIYVKYNTEVFPGYDQPAEYFDAVFKTDKNARGCLAPLPEGQHWLIAFGYDSLYWPHEVYGSLRLNISLDKKPKVDTIFYLSE
jgi:hypothetical protein